jgi:hypothetical protein
VAHFCGDGEFARGCVSSQDRFHSPHGHSPGSSGEASHSDRDLGYSSHDFWSEVCADSPKTAVSLTLAHFLTLFFWSKGLDPEYVLPPIQSHRTAFPY